MNLLNYCRDGRTGKEVKTTKGKYEKNPQAKVSRWQKERDEKERSNGI